jgi:hypothetical protein
MLHAKHARCACSLRVVRIPSSAYKPNLAHSELVLPFYQFTENTISDQHILCWWFKVWYTRDLWICSQELWLLDHRGGVMYQKQNWLNDILTKPRPAYKCYSCWSDVINPFPNIWWRKKTFSYKGMNNTNSKTWMNVLYRTAHKREYKSL